MKRSTRILAGVLPAVALVAASVMHDARAQASKVSPVVGVWKLVSTNNTGADGVKKTGSFGPNPQGMVIFTGSGHYASVNTRPDIPKFASDNRMKGTDAENKAVVQGSNASFGTYTLDKDGKTLTYHVQGGTWPSWNGTDQKRQVKVKGDEMTVTLNASYGGTSELVYKRIK